MKALPVFASLFLFLSAPLVAAADNDEVIRELRRQIETLTERVNELERKAVADTVEPAPAPAPAVAAELPPAAPPSGESWTDRISLSGDVRLRYDHIDREQGDDRNRNRIRARLGAKAALQDDLEVGFRLSTGQDGDPVSTNQTIGDGNSRKDIYIDLAYFDWSPADGLDLLGGKFRNPLRQVGGHPLLWDSDWNPEGFAASYQRGIFFGHALVSWLDGDSSGESTEALVGAQAGVEIPLGDAISLLAGAGWFDVDTAGRGTFFGDDTAFGGNSFDPVTQAYLHDYEELELFTELGFSLAGLPATVFFDYVKNRAADRFDTGWAAGVTLGEARARGTWELGWAFQDLEADAVLALLTDSDFGGGGTDTRGHLLSGAYALGDRWSVGASWFINEIDENQGVKQDFDRVLLDLSFRY